jgi:hypothetical protein
MLAPADFVFRLTSSMAETATTPPQSNLFEGLWTLGTNYALLCAIGSIIILLYSREKYDQPTYEHTAIGNLAPLSPKLLASDFRYSKGLFVYLSLMLTAYAALCLIGPGVAGAVAGGAAGEKAKLPESLTTWPIAATTLLVGSGVAGDTSFFGMLEAKFRRWAHEAAFIPMAVGALANRLTGVDVEKWAAKSGKDSPPVIREILEKRGGPAKLAAAADAEAVWVRANVLYHALQQLKGRSYEAVKAHDKNKRALAFLSAGHASILRSRQLPQPVDEKRLEDEIAAFMEGSSILLAAVMLQAGIDTRKIDEIVPGVAASDVIEPPSCWELIVIGATTLLLTASLPWMAMHAMPDAAVWYMAGDPAPETRIFIINGIVESALILYGCTFIIGIVAREHHVIHGYWRETPGAYLRLACIVGALTAALATLFTATARPPTFVQFCAHLYFNFFVSACAAFFLAWHHREVARSENWREAVFGGSVFVHMAVAPLLTAYLLLSSGRLLYDSPWEALPLLAPSCLTSLLMSLSFSMVVRAGRWLQLDNQIDSGGSMQDALADDLVRRLRETGKEMRRAYEKWLTTPQKDLDDLTPREASRYPSLWDRLTMNAKRQGMSQTNGGPIARRKTGR